MTVAVDKKALEPNLIFSKEIQYNEHITLNPVKMKDIFMFQKIQEVLTLRKDAIFQEKQIIKMEYLDFLKYAYHNKELSEKYHMPQLYFYLDFVFNLFYLVCGENTNLSCNPSTLDFSINDFAITNSVFDDLRKIIIIQNDIDFDTDEFMNIDTVKALEKAREFETKKTGGTVELEDYIDSLAVSINVTEEYISNLTIRKFWRYIKRINKHEEYKACRSGQMSGMVTFKEPIQHWMTSIEVTDKYEDLKTNESELRSKLE